MCLTLITPFSTTDFIVLIVLIEGLSESFRFLRGTFFFEIGEKTYNFRRGMVPIFGPKNGQRSVLTRNTLHLL